MLFFGWDLADVMVLFWAESAVVGFYTVLKIAVVGKLMALLVAPFFVGHFGGFMAACGAGTRACSWMDCRSWATLAG